MVVNFKHDQQPQIIVERFETKSAAKQVGAWIEKCIRCNTSVVNVFRDTFKDDANDPTTTDDP
jgi:hypothetical protein